MKMQFKCWPGSKTEVILQNALPDVGTFIHSLKAEKVILIYDQRLLLTPEIATWINNFMTGCAVVAGENLKSIEVLQKVLPQLLNMIKGVSRQQVVLVAMGGGSVGDFVGFVASIMKRGVRLVHIPTTWLAAIDSAHGGKTALNLGEFKNQVGTFKQAEKIFIFRDVLEGQPRQAAELAFGELIKIALISGKKTFARVVRMKDLSPTSLWRVLPDAIKAKYKIIQRDPFEEKGIRHILNLGHTLGHAFELKNNIPHGEAVLRGTLFALSMSARQRLMPVPVLEDLVRTINRFTNKFSTPLTPMALRPSELREVILHDKKVAENNSVRFVMLRGVGRPVVLRISLDEIVGEAVRQGMTQ